MSYAAPPASSVPAGSMVAYAGSAAPTGWTLCDGTALDRTIYADLFAAIGTAYGAGNGTTTFNVPDMRQRFPLGKAATGTGNALGASGGAIDHGHTWSGSASGGSHTHSVSAGSHSHTMSLSLSSDSQGSHYHNATTGSANIGPSNISAGGSTQVAGMSHTHFLSSDSGGSHSHNISGSGTVDAASASGTSGSAAASVTVSGSNTTTNPPFLVVNYIIKV